MLVRCCSFARGGERSRLCVVLIKSLYSETLVVKMCQCYPHSAVVVVFARGLGLGSLHVIPFDCRTPAISSVLSEQSWSFVLGGGGGRGSKGGGFEVDSPFMPGPPGTCRIPSRVLTGFGPCCVLVSLESVLKPTAHATVAPPGCQPCRIARQIDWNIGANPDDGHVT